MTSKINDDSRTENPHYEPNLMQLYTAYKLKKENGLFNIPRTGTGKQIQAKIQSKVFSKGDMIRR